MAEITVVHLLRHGEVHNPNHVLYGRLPGYHLSANGRMMAAAAADYFDGRPVAAVFASPLERAQETGADASQRQPAGIAETEVGCGHAVCAWESNAHSFRAGRAAQTLRACSGLNLARAVRD